MRKTHDIVLDASKTINLQKNNTIKLPLVSALKIVFSAGLVFVVLFSSTALAPATSAQTSSSTEPAEEENLESIQSIQDPALKRRKLEERLSEVEGKIKEQLQLIEKYRSQSKTLENEIGRLNAQIQSTNLQIRAVNLTLEKLNQDIYETQREINQTQNQIEEHKEALAEALRRLNEMDNQSILAILLKNEKISEFFNNINNILLVQDNIRLSLDDIVSLRQDLLEQKREYSLEKEDVENLKVIRENRKRYLQSIQHQKSRLLQKTQNKESEYQELLEETQKTAAEIRSQIFKLIGGGKLTFEKAYKFAHLAEGATGIRAALILAILDRESLIGKNVGQCYYKEAMHPKRDIPVFLEILKNLNIDPDSTVAKVSCPNQHGTYGGAMGPAQFIPSTWAIYGGYEKDRTSWTYKPEKDEIGEIVGEKPSNPWSNKDAFAATAIYIKDLYNSRTCKNYAAGLSHRYPEQELREECASAMYYSGSRWRTYYTWYGIPVVEHADELQKDIDILKKS